MEQGNGELRYINSLRLNDDKLALHLGTQAALESEADSATGSFTIYGLRPELAAELPGYVREYIGRDFPKVQFTDEGHLIFYEGTERIRVDEADTLFELKRAWVDPETEIDKALYSRIARRESLELEQAPDAPSKRSTRIYRTAAGLLLAGQVAGWSLVGHGLRQEQSAYKATDAAAIHQAENLQDQGGRLIGISAIAGLAYSIHLATQTRHQKEA